MDIITGPGGEAQWAEIVVLMSLKTCNMKHGARRRVTTRDERTQIEM